MDDKVLSYGDVLLRRSDVDLLAGTHYLNDNIIEFFFNYLSSTLFNSCPSVKPAPLLLVGPSLTFWLLHCSNFDGLHVSITPLQLSDREMVMFALNNNEDVETAEGGSHWTLLVYSRQHNLYEHYDSMAGCNWSQAQQLVKIIKPFMGPRAASAELVDQTTPQQENGYDCGVYVMAIAQVLCTAFQERWMGNSVQDVASLLRTQVTPSFVHRMRYTTLELISNLAAKTDCNCGSNHLSSQFFVMHSATNPSDIRLHSK